MAHDLYSRLEFFFSFLIVVPEKLTGNPCTSKETCGDCITADPECAWCSEEVRLFFFLKNLRLKLCLASNIYKSYS